MRNTAQVERAVEARGVRGRCLKVLNLLSGQAGKRAFMQQFANRVRHILFRIESTVCGVLIFALMSIVFWGVIERYVLRMGTGWPDELARYICVWAIMLGACLGVVRGAHVGIEVFVRMLPPRMQLHIERLGYLLCGFFTIWLARVGWAMVDKLLQTGQLTATIEIPIAYAYMAIPVGALLMTVHYALQLMLAGSELKEDMP